MFAGCAVGGVQWGTGRHMDTLSNEDILMAMRVSMQNAYFSIFADSRTVLVAVLYWILLGYDSLQALNRPVPAPSHCHKNTPMDHLHRHGCNRRNRPRLLLCYDATMFSDQLLLEQSPGWLVCTNRCCHRSYLFLQWGLSHLRLHIRNFAHVPSLGLEHVCKDKTGPNPHSGYGLRVSFTIAHLIYFSVADMSVL